MSEIAAQQEGAFPIPADLAGAVQELQDGGASEDEIKEFIQLSTPSADEPLGEESESEEEEPQPVTAGDEPGTAMEIVRGLALGYQRAVDAAGRLIPMPEGMTADDQPIENLTDLMYAYPGPKTEFQLPKTTTGKTTGFITQALIGVLPAMKLIKTLGFSSTLVQTIFGGAIGDFVVGDEEMAKGVLGLIDMLPAEYGGEEADKLVDIIDEWAIDPNKGGYDDLKSRAINAGFGIPFAFAVDRLFKVAGMAAKKGAPALKDFRDTLSTRLRGTGAPATVRSAEQRALDDAHNVVGSRISREGRPRKGVPILSEIYRIAVDRFNPIKRIQRELAEGRELPINLRPYEQARLQVSAMNKANLFLEHEVRSFLTGEVVGPGLKKILEPISGDGAALKRFSDYAVAKRALELMKRPTPIKTGYEAEKAALEKVARDGARQFDGMFRLVLDYQNNVLTYLRDSGVLSKEMVAAIREANKDYVPFFRVMDQGGAGGLTKRIFNPLRAIKGSERDIIDPLESIIKNTYAYVQLAERNNVIRALHDLSKTSVRGKELVKVLPQKGKPIKITGEELEEAIKKADPDSELLDVLRQYAGADGAKILPDDISIFRAMAAPEKGNTVAYMKNGKRITLEVDEDVAKALKDMDETSLGILTRLFSVPAKTLRAGAILDPEFFVRNAGRDNVTAAVYSANGFQPFLIDFTRGLVSLVRKDKYYKDWLYGGGAQATLVSLDRQYLRENLKQLMGSADLYTAAKNVIKSPLEILRVVTELAENATRIGEFKRAVKGAPRTKESMQSAAFEAREITLDFARRGAGMKGLNMLSAFLNARIQGYDRLARAMFNHPIRTTSKAAMYITTPSILLWVHNNATEERAAKYRAVPEWQKNLFWVVVIDGQDEPIRIPKPFELGVLFGSVPERILDVWLGNRSLEDMPMDMLKALGLDSRSIGSSVMPTAAQPIVEDWSNYSWFRDRPLEPASLSDPLTAPLPQDRYTTYTSETAKKLSELFAGHGIPVLENMSPIQIENYISQWTGGLGRKAMELIIEPTGRALEIFPEQNRPERTLADIPFVKGFVIRHPDPNSQPIVDFYKRSDKAMQYINSLKKREREGDLEGMKRLMNSEDGKAMRYASIEDFLHETRAEFSELSAQISEISRSPTMGKTTKRVLIDNSLIMMNTIAVNANKMLDHFSKSRRAWEGAVGK